MRLVESMMLLQANAVHSQGLTALVRYVAGSCLRRVSCHHVVDTLAATLTSLKQLPAASPAHSYLTLAVH